MSSNLNTAGVADELADAASTIRGEYRSAANAYIASLSPALWLKCDEPDGSTSLVNSGTLAGQLSLNGNYALNGEYLQLGDPSVAGARGYALMPNAAAPPVTDNMSFCCWLRHTPNADNATGKYGTLLTSAHTAGNGSTTHGTGYGASISFALDSEIETAAYWECWRINTTRQHAFRPLNDQTERGWQFLAYRSKATPNVRQRAHIDVQRATEEVESSASYYVTSAVHDLRIGGGRSNSVNESFQGQIKHLMIWNIEVTDSMFAKIHRLTMPEFYL